MGVDPYEYARSIDENRTVFHVIRKVENRSFAVFHAGEKALFLAYIGFVSVGVDAQVDPYEYARSIDENRTMFHAIRKVENRSFDVFHAKKKHCF